jgi:hypothetical protein
VWVRTKLIEGDDGPVVARKIEDYAKARLDFTIATSDAVVPPLVARTYAIQDGIWRTTQVIVVVRRRSGNTDRDPTNHEGFGEWFDGAGVPRRMVITGARPQAGLADANRRSARQTR